MKNTIAYPTFDEMYPNAKHQPAQKRWREQLRYKIYSAWHRKQCHQLVDYLNQNPLWIPLFKGGESHRFTALLRVYCDKRFQAQQRVDAVIQNLELMKSYFGETLCQQLLDQQSIVLSQLTENLRLNLNINGIDVFEGFFSINITTNDNQRIYDASFTLLEPNKLLIASIQGPNYENAADAIKQATKELHGVRPMFMLINGFRDLAQTLNLELVGIPHRNQAKNRLSARKDILFNYDEFWQENQGVRQGNYWHLPVENPRKPLDEIPSKKRSMYRKRYEMLDQISQDIQQFFN